MCQRFDILRRATFDDRLDPTAVKVLCLYLSRADSPGVLDVAPTTVAEDVGAHRVSAIRSRQKLVDAGYLTKAPGGLRINGWQTELPLTAAKVAKPLPVTKPLLAPPPTTGNQTATAKPSIRNDHSGASIYNGSRCSKTVTAENRESMLPNIDIIDSVVAGKERKKGSPSSKSESRIRAAARNGARGRNGERAPTREESDYFEALAKTYPKLGNRAEEAKRRFVATLAAGEATAEALLAAARKWAVMVDERVAEYEGEFRADHRRRAINAYKRGLPPLDRWLKERLWRHDPDDSAASDFLERTVRFNLSNRGNVVST